MALHEMLQIIPLLAPADYQAGSQDLDSINMGKLHHVTILIQLGVITGNSSTIQLYSGATAGTKTTELTYKYRKSTVDTPAASADVFDATATSVATGASGLVFTDAGDYNARTLRIDVSSDAMTDAEPWLTVATDDGSASALFMSAVAVGYPRFQGDTHTTAL